MIKAGIRVIIELRKEVKDRDTAQVILQMISADIMIHDGIKVFGVLTDLNSTWNIYYYWIEDKQILTITLSNRKKALEIISKMSTDNNGNSVDVKVSEPMKDVYDQMDEDEIHRHKLYSIFKLLKYNPLFSNMYAKPQYPPQQKDYA
ncbi:5588_t:CDS:2 [Paraglomus occultum]|uniref:5588_t:CDS:1 n=1 Tax=Paraglomus occultum TaxID=144539 RepID=A0A9N9F281_9GLOM|nr:5588_t:CDS:2 [Paraglomus occultum]